MKNKGNTTTETIKKQKSKKKLLVFASTFPRWKNDTNPPFVYELSKRMKDKFEVSVLAPSYPGAKDFEVMDDMNVYRFHYFFKKMEKLAGSGGILPTLKKHKLFYFQVPFFMIAEFFALRKLVKKIKPDVIHAHWIIPQGFITSLVKKLTGVPYVITSHGSDVMGLKGFRLIKKFTLNNAKKITVVSNALKEKILQEIDSNLKIEVIPMGVDTNLFNPKKRDLIIKKKHKINGPFLLFVGRLSYEKGIDLLLEAMPQVTAKFPTAKLMIIGDGALKERLIQRVNQLQVQDKVLFMGGINNKELPKYYATADVFVCPSRREGLGLTLLEAGLSGCSIIGTSTGGIKDVIRDKINGLLLQNLTVDEIANSINFLLSKKHLCKLYGRNSLKLFKIFSWIKIKNQFNNLYQEVTN